MLDYSTVFGVACIGMVLLSILWFLLERRLPQQGLKYIGSIGTAVAAFIVAGAWLVEYLPWIWMIPKASMPLWLLTFVLMGIGLSTGFRQHESSQRPLVIVGFLSLGLNAVAMLAFLAMAMLSAGGV